MQWMFFFCDDDATLQKLADEYGPGPVRAGNKMLTGEAKKLLIETLKPIIMQHQKVRTFPKGHEIKHLVYCSEC